MTLQPINIRALVGAPAATVAGYGRKTAGVVELLRLRDGAPVRYDVPDGWAIPPRSQGACTHQELQCAFDALVAARPRGALMARSSGLGELPGQNPTLVSGYDRADRAGSFRRFADNVEAVLDAGPDVGVLAMAMVGKLSRLKDGRRVLGFHNTSFVADTHSAFRSADMYIAAVHGLGTRAVEVDGGAIGLTADRKTGAVLSVDNQSEAMLCREFGSSWGPVHIEDYRQRVIDYYHLGDDAVRAQAIDQSFMDGVPRYGLVDGVLMRAEEAMAAGAYLRGTNLFCEMQRSCLPFGTAEAVWHLVSLLEYFSGRGPCQIEGAYPNRDSMVPVLYQMIDLPSEQAVAAPLHLTARHIATNQVVGRGRIAGPLVYVPKEAMADLRVLQDLDERYGAEGYILVLPCHNWEAMNVTPHCRYRISVAVLNPTAHAVALTRLYNAAHPASQHLLAMGVQLDVRGEHRYVTGGGGLAWDRQNMRIAGIKPDEVHPWGIVYHEATMESNGEAMAVRLGPPVRGLLLWCRRALAQVAPGLAGKW